MALISALCVHEIFAFLRGSGADLICLRPVSALMLTKWFSANAPVSAF